MIRIDVTGAFMIRTVFYLVQVCALVFMTGWLLSQNGRYDIAFGDYRFSGETSVLAVLFLIGLFVLLMIHRLWLWILRIPVLWRRYRRDLSLVKGHQALTRSLSALASGDLRVAHYQAHRARKFLPDFSAVPSILIATTAERQGKTEEARNALADLMKTEARDLGVRGLVNAALNEEKWDQALAIARAALNENRRAVMMARLVYDLECQIGQYAQALSRQRFLIRHKGLSHENARRDKIVIMTALAQEYAGKDQHKKALGFARAAFDLDPGFTPAASILIDLYRGFGKIRRAKAILFRAFTACPHPDLIERHEQMAPQVKNLARRMRYHEKLLSLRPDSADAQLLLARVALTEGMIGEAQAYLHMAEKLAPRRGIYRLLAEFSESQGDTVAASDYLNKGLSAPSDPVWICRVTRRVFREWQPLIMPEHLFGTMIWNCPDIGEKTERLETDGHRISGLLP